MKKLLITGFSGFVASHFLEYLYQNDILMDICGISRSEPVFDYVKYQGKLPIRFYTVDLMDAVRLKQIFEKEKPDYVLHLAAYSSVAYSWKQPEESFTNNSNIFLNLIKAKSLTII